MFGIVPYRRGNNVASRNDIWDLRNVFDSFFNDSFFNGALAAVPAIRADIRETADEFVIDAEIPGAKKEDIKLELKDDILTISLENRSETKEERENYIRRERRFGSCSRSFYLDNVKHEDIKAAYENGILTVTIPKKEEAKSKNRSIEIN